MTFLPARGIAQLSFYNVACCLAQRRQQGLGLTASTRLTHRYSRWGQCQLVQLLPLGCPSRAVPVSTLSAIR